MHNISVIILTKNEESDLPGCLSSVAWCNDIHVYDSFSVDQTEAIAKRAGASVVKRVFDDWSTHQNWGLRNIIFKNEWVLYLDADERITEGLKNSIIEAISRSSNFVAYRVRRRDFFNGRWLRFTQASPYYIRLFRPSYIKYERLVNPVTIVDGETGTIGGFLDHHPFSKGISHWVERHNKYSMLEAIQVINNRKINKKSSIWQALFCTDFNKRRFHQKEFFYKIPARPYLKFLIMYFVRGGFLDGGPGFTYCRLQSFYEYMITLKIRELEGKIF